MCPKYCACDAKLHPTLHRFAPNTAPATSLPRKMALSRCPAAATQFARCHQPWQCDSQKNTHCDTSKVLRLPREMTTEVSKVLRLPRNMQVIFWKRRKSIAPATQNDFGHVCRHMRMSGSAMPATQNDITTSFDTFEKERFCSFPHRHGDATRKPENQTRHVATSKRAFRARLLQIFKLCISKSTFAYEFS